MKGKPNDLDQILDQAIDEIRHDAMDASTERRVTDQVWQTILPELVAESRTAETGTEQIRSCDGFQSLIPAFVRGELGEARMLLLQDHVGECVPCRRALKQARTAGASRPAAVPERTRSPLAVWGWRFAAAAAVFVALIGLDIQTGLFTIRAGGMITIEKIEGEVFRVTDDGAVPVSVGDRIEFSDTNGLRTAKSSGAFIRLADNSLVEMNERAQLAVKNQRKLWQTSRRDGVIELERGSIIIEASDQGSGHLFVETADTAIAVTGTVFAVNTGVKGSRVSVIEGEVLVAHNSGTEETLHAGHQSTSGAQVGRVAIGDEIAWSENAQRHLALLAELTRVAREIEQEIQWPGLRYSTTLLDLAPEGTSIYVGIPNVSTTISEAYDMLQVKVAENELLNQWWNDSMVGSDADQELQRIMDRLRSWGEHLGDEIAVAIPLSGQHGEVDDPLVVSTLSRPGAFRAFVESELAELPEDARDEIVLIGENNTLPTGSAGHSLFIWCGETHVAVSSEPQRIWDFVNSLDAGRSSFSGSAFHDRLSDLYTDGVEWVVGVDVASLMDDDGGPDSSQLEALGLTDMQHVFVERKERDGMVENRVVVTFDQPRRGLASWLAEPAPVGAMDFISPQATLAAGFAMREPAAVLDELFARLGANDSELERSLAELENEHGIDVRADFIDALGGEFAFALDGPLLPIPAWKVIVEVYDPARLQTSLEWVVSQLTQELAADGRRGLAIERHEAGGRTFHRIESLDLGLSVHYTFVDGYMVVSSARQYIQRALQNRNAGITLTGSAQFRELLPADAQVNFSAVVYQNMGAVLGPLARTLGNVASQFTDDQTQLIDQLGNLNRPSLTLAYGERERIVFVNTGEGGLLGSTLGSFLRLDTLTNMQQMLQQAAEQNQTGEHGARDSAEADVPSAQAAVAG